VNASRVSMATCGRCHSDERLALRYNLPADKVPSYADSYHGLASRGGSQSVANCASCHGVHNILPVGRSAVHRECREPSQRPAEIVMPVRVTISSSVRCTCELRPATRIRS
jgi:hypothetical protein